MNGEFVGKYNSTPVRVRDISKGGAGIQISKPLAGGTELLKGEVVDTKIDFNNGTIVTIKARVAWTMSDAVSQVQVCGLEVIEPVQAWRAAVDNFVPETTQKPKVVIPVH
jgi:c-di-GMP-binding flagellar brake protein YcgR